MSDQVQTHTPRMVTFDLADTGATIAAAAEILQCFGHMDVLVNNAGVSYRGTILDTPVDVDRRVMETNYFGPIALTKGNVSDGREKHTDMLVCVFSLHLVPPLFHPGNVVIYSSGACFPRC